MKTIQLHTYFQYSEQEPLNLITEMSSIGSIAIGFSSAKTSGYWYGISSTLFGSH